MIFDYSLNPGYLHGAGGNPGFQEGGPSAGYSNADDDDIFFRVHKNELTESKQFDQVINPDEESPRMFSRASRLGIM